MGGELDRVKFVDDGQGSLFVSLKGEATYDPQHCADMILHIAGLPNSVQVLTVNIMYATFFLVKAGSTQLFGIGLSKCHS
jgi:NADP-dependent 3-hydroxy acid dehydrogenase YdfG